jgi:hypothetical protein
MPKHLTDAGKVVGATATVFGVCMLIRPEIAPWVTIAFAGLLIWAVAAASSEGGTGA